MLPPGEPHAATSRAAAARPERAVPRLSTRRGRRPACDEHKPGAAGRYMAAMTMVLLVPVTLLLPVDTPAVWAVFTARAETCRRDDPMRPVPPRLGAGRPGC